MSCTGNFHKLTKDCPQHEDHQVTFCKICEASHIGLRKGCKYIQTADRCNQHCTDGSHPQCGQAFKASVTEYGQSQ